jgi:uncharacterized membrane protein YoaK (UPF0700 family)
MILKKKIRQIVPKHMNTYESLRLGVILAAVGGFLDAYTYIGRGGVFANAETGNIVLFAIGLAQKNYKISLLAIIQIISFALGALLTESIRHKQIEKGVSPEHYGKIILIIEALVLFIVGLIPESASNTIVTAIIAFVSAMQISAFRILVDSPYSTTICTGNLRTASESIFKAIKNKDEKMRARAIRYFLVIILFGLGAALGGILTAEFGVKSIFVAVGLLIVAYLMFYYDKYRFKDVK